MTERVKVAKVFLSSTAKDLIEFRDKAARAINSMDGYQCIQMENFGARDASAEEFCPDQVKECDLFVLLLGPTYGSCPPGAEKSFTELEYETAVELKKPRLVFASSSAFAVPQGLLDTIPDGDRKKARDFRQRVGAERIWGAFTAPDELASQIKGAIPNWEKSRQAEGEETARSEYLNYLINRNTYLDPRGIMQTVRTVSLKLDEVHVLLTAEREVMRGPMWDRRLRQMRAGLIDELEPGEDFTDLYSRDLFAGEMPETRTERVDLDSTVRDHGRIVILGDPGAGKTTLLRFLALQFGLAVRSGEAKTEAATETSPENAASAQTAAAATVRDKEGHEYGAAQLPILVRIAEYAEAFAKDRNLKLREYLPNLCGNMNAPEAIAPVLNRALKQGQALVLLDGLDEIIDSGDRAQIARQIEDFVAGVDARNRFIVTSRIAGYRSASLGGEFAHFTLRDLEREQIERFLTRWCVSVERFQTPDAPETEISRRARQMSDGILKAIDDNPGVRRLAANPLMLTILALIYRQGARLPKRRVDLYELATKTLLEDWRLAQVSDAKVGAKVVRENEALRLLGPLAHWMHTHKPSGLAHEHEVKDKLAAALAATRNKQPDDAEVQDAVVDFLQRVREHTGIFVERAPQQYGFMHLTFEEYFTARELVRRPRDSAARIYERRHEPRWAEPILLAIGFVSNVYPDEAGALIQTAILAEGEDAVEQGFAPSLYEDVLHRDLLFAAQCMGDCAGVEASLRQQVVCSLVEMYLDVKRAGKYSPLRDRIAACLGYFEGSEAGEEAARLLLAALRDKNAEVRSQAVWALGEIKASTPEVVTGLLAALRDESEYVRRHAAWALGEIVKGRAPKLRRELIEQVTTDLRAALDDPRNEAQGYPFISDKYYAHVYEAIWEALWLVCQKLGTANQSR